MKRKYIRYRDTRVYAIYYSSSSVIYYNLDFSGGGRLIIIK